MKDIQNEKGIALIMAILTLVVFSILGLAIVTVTNQGQKQRDLSNEQIEGKMLADTGLLFFQKYLEKNLNFNDTSIQSAIKSPGDPDGITNVIDQIASRNEGKIITLPDGKGAFQIQYQIKNLLDIERNPISTIPYQVDSNSLKPYSQPYVRKLSVIVIGIPADTAHFKKVKLTATLYINTVSSPFHYAISTPNELNLNGGSNIIGNVTANQVNVSTQYYYSDQNTYYFEPENPINLPYVEGKIFLTGNPVFSLKSGPWPQDSEGHPAHYPSVSQNVYTDRQSLESIFTPYPPDAPSPPVDALEDKPYVPGSEPPLVESSTRINQGLAFNLEDYIKSQFQTIAPQAGTKLFVNDTDQQQPIWIGAGIPVDGFRTINSFANSDIAIYSEQIENQIQTSTAPNHLPPFLLTARLTDNTFSSPRRLFIGPDPNFNSVDYAATNAVVEIGHNSSFNDLPNYPSDNPFTFNGSIFIKGNLDIVGDINVNGTIYVDGNVNIRENIGSNVLSEIPNLAILSTGTITISNRNTIGSNNFDWNNRLSTFLYSERQPIKIYSHTSVNWFYGGLATGSGSISDNPYIELDAKREGAGSSLPYASHMTVQFNRGIFERETPGLPSDDQFYFDIYDLNYSMDPPE
jgi:cytoskeletal protein CcmA (bactofilin family)